jgi:hypothetical protein
VVSFTPLPLYPRGNSPRYPMYRRLGEPVWMLWKRENLAPTGNRTPAVQSVARCYTELSRLFPAYYTRIVNPDALSFLILFVMFVLLLNDKPFLCYATDMQAYTRALKTKMNGQIKVQIRETSVMCWHACECVIILPHLCRLEQEAPSQSQRK